MKRQYQQDRADAIMLNKNIDSTQDILTQQKLSCLPKAIQHYYQLCGFIGKPIAMNADIIWEESHIKIKPEQNWKKLTTRQFNSVNPIMRTALMKVNSMFFTGKDLYKDGQGSMKAKILNLFPIINATGKELSQSALITSFSEMLLLSGYALQDYIKWQEIDAQTVKAELQDHDFQVTGIFHFDATGKWTSFETEDRYFDQGKGNHQKIKFTAKVASYRHSGDYYLPYEVSVSWWLDTGEYEYYKGKIKQINYNVKQ